MPLSTLEDELRLLGLSLIGKPPRPGSSMKQQNHLFCAHYGTGWEVTAFLWQALFKVNCEKNLEEGKTTKMKKKHFLWCLYFLKVYATENVSASTMACDPITFWKWVWIYVRDIAFLAPIYVSFVHKKSHPLPFSCFSLLRPFVFQINIENRYEGDVQNDCLLSFDTTDCPVDEPYPFQKRWSERWSSHKFGKKAGLRYELAIAILSGEICWYNGPFPCGLYNDWKIFNECRLRTYLEKHERVEADNGYSAGDPEVCKTPGGCFHPASKKRCKTDWWQGRKP